MDAQAVPSSPPAMKCLGLLGCDDSLLCADYEWLIRRGVTDRCAGQIRANFISLTLHVPILPDVNRATVRQEMERLISAGVTALELSLIHI